MMHSINIEAPAYLALLAIVPLLWWAAGKYRNTRLRLLRAFGSEEILQRQLNGTTFLPKNFWIFLTGLAFVILAATNPRIKGKPLTIKRKGGDVIFALDVSRSMLAQDVKPSRLDRAKLVVRSLLKGFDNQRVALVLFAGEAYVALPFTTDYSTVADFVQEASPDLLSDQGSDFANLITTLEEYFGDENFSQRGVVVLSDGEDHSQLTKEMVRKAYSKGLVFFPVGIGTEKGAPVPAPRGYLTDENGKKVISRLNRKSLLLLAGNKGQYFSVNETRRLLSTLRRLKKHNFSEMKTYEYFSLYPFLLIPGILMMVWPFVRFRRKAAHHALPLLLMLLSALPVLAQNTHKLLLEADKRYLEKDYLTAARLYQKVNEKTPNSKAVYNEAVALNKAGKKKEAVKKFLEVAQNSADPLLKADALYNAATSQLYDRKKIDQNIKLLKQALNHNPNDFDIRKNLAKALQMKRKIQQQQQKNKNQNQQQKDNKQKDNKQKDNKQNQQQSNQQDKKQQQNKQQQQKQQQNQQQPQQNQSRKKKDMNQQMEDLKKRSAERILQEIEKREKKVRRKVIKGRRGKGANSRKKW